MIVNFLCLVGWKGKGYKRIPFHYRPIFFFFFLFFFSPKFGGSGNKRRVKASVSVFNNCSVVTIFSFQTDSINATKDPKGDNVPLSPLPFLSLDLPFMLTNNLED